MSQLPVPLAALVNTHPEDSQFYLFPPPGNRQPSVMYQYKGRIKIKIVGRHRRLVVAMKVTRNADRREGVDREYEGFRSIKEWARILNREEDTIRHYLSQISKSFKEANVDPDTYFFEYLEETGYRGIRIREGVVIVEH